MKQVETTLLDWLSTTLKCKPTDFTPSKLAGDASARQYFRLQFADSSRASLVLMDARRLTSECEPFISIGTQFAQAGLLVPEVLAQDLEQGLLLLTDFGDELLLQRLYADRSAASLYYAKAFDIIHRLQRINDGFAKQLPRFDVAFMQNKVFLFEKWFLSNYMAIDLSKGHSQHLYNIVTAIAQQLAMLPQTVMHRDFHAKNLMCVADQLGVIDFQGAMVGPLVYDLVSLLKDCYIDWPRPQLEQWVQQFYQGLPAVVRNELDVTNFLYHFDLMGVVRHLKCLGAFSRLYLRDQKNAYLDAIPRVLRYINQVIDAYVDTDVKWQFLRELFDKVAQNAALQAMEPLELSE